MTAVKMLNVDLGERSYPIWIGPGLLNELSQYLTERGIGVERKLFVITDEHVAPLYLERVLSHLKQNGYTVYAHIVPPGEQAKSFACYEQVISQALIQRLDRTSVILALGGGVVGDLAGFVASTYMRGIPFVQLPTTLLAHDSSVGGKVAINHPLGKNMIGSFYQPLAVIYDTATLTTLPTKEISSGYAEVLKHAFIWDPAFVDWLEKEFEACIALKEPYLTEALARASAIKCEVVRQDERENGLRAILNFGHTFGHAFEALGEYRMFSHGEAIAMGMALAAVVSERVYGTPVAKRIVQLLQQYGLPVDWQKLPWPFDEVLQKMYADKKVRQGKLRLVLLERMGKAVVTDQVDEALLRACWQVSIESIV